MHPRSAALLAAAAAALAAAALSGCGGGSQTSSTHVASTATRSTASNATSAAGPRTAATPPVVLVGARQPSLPAPRSGTAAAALGDRIVVAGGLSDADVSTDTVFLVPAAGPVRSLPRLPSAIHDAAAATVGDRLLVFGGGVSEGSDHILQVQPGPPREIATLPQALSDLVAAPIDGVAYVTGGWNGAETNSAIYAMSATGPIRVVGHLPLGVRYPAAGTLGGRLLIAGGEMTSGTPTAAAWSFDPASGAVTRLPGLPVPTDHAASAVANGRFYILGGLRSGVLTRAIISWAPGESRWRRSGELPEALADASAVAQRTGIVLLGGRTAGGRVGSVIRLTPR